MLHDTTPAADKRAAFRAGLASGTLLRFPGAFNPLSAILIARHHFEGVYVSGAVVSADLGLPDIGLTTRPRWPAGLSRSPGSLPCPRWSTRTPGSASR